MVEQNETSGRIRSTEPFTYKDKLGYFFGDFANNMTFALQSSFLLLFYTQVLGIEGAVAGSVFFVARFVGLVMGLESVNYEGIDNLKRWIDETSNLSNDSLEKEIEEFGSEDLKKALAWSEEVNKSVAEAEGFDKPFPGAKEGLKTLADNGTVYVVSSANKEAVESEWSRHGLLEYVKDLYCQDRGKKADVINMLIEQGNSPENIFMIGDSPGDLKAADVNNTWFYPIIVGSEEASWNTLSNELINQITAGEFGNETQEKYTNAFWSNLEK